MLHSVTNNIVPEKHNICQCKSPVVTQKTLMVAIMPHINTEINTALANQSAKQLCKSSETFKNVLMLSKCLEAFKVENKAAKNNRIQCAHSLSTKFNTLLKLIDDSGNPQALQPIKLDLQLYIVMLANDDGSFLQLDSELMNVKVSFWQSTVQNEISGFNTSTINEDLMEENITLKYKVRKTKDFLRTAGDLSDGSVVESALHCLGFDFWGDEISINKGTQS